MGLIYKTGRLYGGGSGGTGDVADVYVNGASVLDANKIAQITNYIELTQAEYDALPATKESDNVLYCIKDAASGDPTYAGMEETVLYTATDNTPVNITVDLTAYDAYLIRDTDGPTQTGNSYFYTAEELARFKASGTYLTLWDWTSQVLMYSITNTGLEYYARYSGNFVIWEIIGLKFIPTVNIESSSANYSTTEHKVGTWVDGSNVYEKTIALPQVYVGSSQTTDITTLTGINYLIDARGTVIESDITYQLPEPGIRIKMTSNNVLQFASSSGSSWDISSGYITIRYTKSAS